MKRDDGGHVTFIEPSVTEVSVRLGTPPGSGGAGGEMTKKGVKKRWTGGKDQVRVRPRPHKPRKGWAPSEKRGLSR